MADYAISNVPRRVVYAASGTGPYAFTFEILAAGDIAVYKGDTLLTLTTDYTVTINANGTGSVTLVVTAGTSNITIVGSKTIARTTDFTTGGDFFANTLNDELDAQTIFIQQVAETAERGMKAPVTDPTDINMTLPRKADRAGKYLAFDANGNPQPGDTAIEVAAVFAIREEIEAVAAIDTEVVAVAGNSANIDTVAGSIANVNTVGTNIANVNTTATNIANVNAVGADLLEAVSEINTVAVDIANVNSVGTNISNVNSVAGNATNINAVAGNSSNINTVAGNNANVTTVAGISANVTTVAGISANVTSVAGNSTNINAVAGNATNINAVNANSTNINTVAGISANVTTVATDIANINTVASDLNEPVSEIDTVATNIANVNTVGTDIANVNTCATNMAAIIDAPNQAAAAAASAAAAAASYDNFDDRYLGVKTANPTLDNDGNALVAGALYFNSGAVTPADKGMYVYDGAVWIPASAASSAILIVYQYTATAGQTTFSGSDNNALTLAYTAGSAIVTLNGVILEVPSEVTASSGSSVVLAVGAAAGDELNVYAFATFDIANTYTQAQVDAFAVKLTGAQTVAGVKTFSNNLIASSNVGIGTSSPANSLTVSGAAKNIAVLNTNAGTGASPAFSGVRFYGFSEDQNGWIAGVEGGNAAAEGYAGVLRFLTRANTADIDPAERMRITSAGYTKASNSGTYISATGTYHEFSSNVTGAEVLQVKATNASYNSEIIIASADRNTTNNSYYFYRAAIAGIGTKFLVADSGNVTNSNGSYGTISDIKNKENIVDATPKLDKVNQLQVRNFNFKGDDLKQIGFVAQEFEQVFPSMVEEHHDKDAEGNDLGTTTKSIKTTVLVPILVKAIQEQQALIENLTTRLTALENK